MSRLKFIIPLLLICCLFMISLKPVAGDQNKAPSNASDTTKPNLGDTTTLNKPQAPAEPVTKSNPVKDEEDEDDGWDDDEDDDWDEDEDKEENAGPPNPLWGTPNDFSHLLHVDKEKLLCTECHKGIKTAEAIRDIKPIPSKGCVKCHKQENFKNYNPSIFPTIDPSFQFPHSSLDISLVFSHKTHATEQKIKCTECHGEAIKELGKVNTLSALPTMESCTDCHVKKADNSCLSCHDKMEKPLNHYTSFWSGANGHGFESRLITNDCSSCHTEQNTCESCHQGLDRDKAHPPGYKFSHGMDVKFRATDCSACHMPVQQFCGDCHENMGR